MFVRWVTRWLLGALLVAGTQQACAAKKWRLKEGCTLIDHPANDGDSFHVRVNKRHYLFRLYWVDTPETDLSLPERVAEQAAYFGLSPEETVKVGKEAEAFSRKFLQGSFTVHTKFADAMGRSARDRDYAIIEKDGTYLHVELVRAGLARIHGLEEVSEDMPSLGTMRMRLKAAEAEAKREARGGWSRHRDGGKVAAYTGPYTLPRSVTVLDLQDPTRALGVLRAGAGIEVLGPESTVLTRIRFQAGEASREGLCRTVELGL